MRTIITIVKAHYSLMSQLLLNILSNVTVPPYPSFYVHFKHTFVTHPTKIFRSSITVKPSARNTACHPPKNSELAPICYLIDFQGWATPLQYKLQRKLHRAAPAVELSSIFLMIAEIFETIVSWSLRLQDVLKPLLLLVTCNMPRATWNRFLCQKLGDKLQEKSHRLTLTLVK